ncbi:Serine carboxypeptidase-like 40, partial [Cucurbita argyrosperma subsp. argyrosperma]
MAMRNSEFGSSNLLCFCFFFFVFSSFSIQIDAKNQKQALDALYKSKFFKNSNAAASSELFDPNAVLDQNADDLQTVEIYDQTGLKRRDKIQRLPGQPPRVKFSQYGGYVTVDQSAGRAFYYYFVESPHHKNALPLLLWLNGGPGCSSLAYGAMAELGPFRVRSDGKTLFENKFSWNHVANVLFLESPTGVGFSYSNTTSDYKTNGDKNTAKDNYAFLVNWLERFPEYKQRSFYIAGESYAGHYVPQLAHTILSHNKKAGKTIINLKGIIIGNAVINDLTDQIGMYDFFASHALIHDRTANDIKNFCDFSPDATVQSKKCIDAMNTVDLNTGVVDIYNIYYPICQNTNLTDRPKKATVMNYDPCTDYYTFAYLNRAEVQEAMHANVTKLSYDWEPCSDVITGWSDSASTVIPLLQEFVKSGLRVWVFSGDVDGRVPITSTKYSIDSMNLHVNISWYPWFIANEVGGYAEVYEGDLTLATVRGAGHEVPSYQPRRALALIKHFLQGTPLPPFHPPSS